MPYLIGQCCVDQIITGNDNPALTAINETIDFTNLSELVLPWNGTRIAKYGRKGSFLVEIIGPDAIMRATNVEIIASDPSNPTSYHFDFGGVSSGTITIS